MTVELEDQIDGAKVANSDGQPVAQSADPQAESAHRTIIEPDRGWQFINVRELWRYRELLFFLCWRDVKVRYKQTVLGAAWAILQPGMMMVVFTIFFSRLGGMSSGETPYPLFVLAGLLPWMFFTSAVAGASNSVVGSESLISKIYFPRLVIPFGKAIASLVDFVIAMGLLFVMMPAYGYAPSWNFFLAPVVFGIIFLAATGLGTLLAALSVTYRDFRYVVPFMLQLGMFATPTIYMQPTGNEGRTMQWLLIANPLTSLIAGFRASLLGGPIPWLGIGIALAVAVALMVIGCLYFRKVEDRFADII